MLTGKPQTATRTQPRGFTLVELLVVITIIAILAALLTVAATAAMKRARSVRIKVDVDQLSMAVETYAGEIAGGDYPPNTMTDSNNTSNPINATVRNDLLRHFKRAFPNSRESVDLVEALAGVNYDATPGPTGFANNIPGGLTAAEALVFWMGGFSKDPNYPISGAGGPSYLVQTGGLDPNAQDTIEERSWVIPLEITRLTPRNDAGYFDEANGRFLTYPDPRGAGDRRINFWRYNGPNSNQPILYFDASRHLPNGSSFVYDPPLDGYGSATVYSLKTLSVAGSNQTFRFANDKKFQILHCGIDDDWGPMTRFSTDPNVNSPEMLLTYPTGPFTGALADTITNFSEGTLEDSQP
jgi:prepilin-type N-terminal cleavage/methylation domain-containing protein